MKKFWFYIVSVALAYVVGSLFPFGKELPQRTLGRLMRSQQTELELSERRLKRGNELLEALPVDKLIEYSDEQQERFDREHEERKARWEQEDRESRAREEWARESE